MLRFILLAAALAIPQKQASDHKSSELVQAVAESGRCADIGDKPDQRVDPKPQIAPGPPPLLSFRYYEGKLHHRYGNAELMLDDAGH